MNRYQSPSWCSKTIVCVMTYQNYFASHYGSAFEQSELLHSERIVAPLLRSVLNDFAVSPHSRVLEIGSGLGGTLTWLEKQGFTSVTGLELDPNALQFLKSSFPGYSVVGMDIDHFAESISGKFDLILAFEVLEHLDSPLTSLRAIRKLLSPGGLFIATSPFPFKRNVINDPTHRFVLHSCGWERLLLISEFKVLRSKSIWLVPVLHRFFRAKYVRGRNPVCGVSTSLFVATAEG